MKLTVEDLFFLNFPVADEPKAKSVLAELAEMTLPIRESVIVKKLSKSVEREIGLFTPVRAELIKRYNIQADDETKKLVLPLDDKKFRKEWVELFNTTADVDYQPIKVESIEAFLTENKVAIKPRILRVLDNLNELFEKDKEAEKKEKEAVKEKPDVTQ